MEHLSTPAISIEQQEKTIRSLEVIRADCRAIKCKNVGRAGCVLEGILSSEAKARLAEPCQMAVKRLPERKHAA